jgi:hypothetical protein
MISRDTYLKLRDMSRRYEAARKRYDPKRYQRGGGYTPKDCAAIAMIAGIPRDTTNDEKGQVEEFEWRMFPPSKYFAYYDKGLTEITNFTGICLGGIIWKGEEFRDNLGGRRQNIKVLGSNNVFYTGVCNKSSGTYCRLTRIKGVGLKRLMGRGIKGALPNTGYDYAVIAPTTTGGLSIMFEGTKAECSKFLRDSRKAGRHTGSYYIIRNTLRRVTAFKKEHSLTNRKRSRRNGTFKRGDAVLVPHKGRMQLGKVVRYDLGGAYRGSPFYVVDVGEYASIEVPVHKIRESAKRNPVKTAKHFMVVTVSKNMNSFGLKGMILMARDGETWQVGVNHMRVKKPGDLLRVPYSRSSGPEWFVLGYEIPEKLPKAPGRVASEVWG